LPGLQAVAVAHADDSVRREAGLTAERLGRAAARPTDPSDGSGPVTAAGPHAASGRRSDAFAPEPEVGAGTQTQAGDAMAAVDAIAAGEAIAADDTVPPADASAVEAWLADIEDGAVLLLARRSRVDPATLDALTIRTDAQSGIVEYAIAERAADGLRSVHEAFERAGTPLRPIDAAHAAIIMDAATELTLEAGHGHGYAWAGWRAVLGRPPAG
jgi:hypothetical protein